MKSEKKNAPIESNESAKKQAINFDLKNSTKPFVGTKNMAELRAIDAFMKAGGRSVSRNDLDRICGTSNSPEIVRRLRGKGLRIECEIKGTVNRFGEPVKAGFYRLTQQDKVQLRLWARAKSQGAH